MKVASFFLLAKLLLVVSVHFSSASDSQSPCLPEEEELLHNYRCFDTDEENPSNKQKPAVPTITKIKENPSNKPAVPTITKMKDDDYCFVPQSPTVASQIKEKIPVIARSIVALTIAKILVDRNMDNLFNQILKYATNDSTFKESLSNPSKSNDQQ